MAKPSTQVERWEDPIVAEVRKARERSLRLRLASAHTTILFDVRGHAASVNTLRDCAVTMAGRRRSPGRGASEEVRMETFLTTIWFNARARRPPMCTWTCITVDT